MPAEQQNEMIVDIGGGRQRKMPVDYPSNSRTRRPAERARQQKIEGIEVIQRKPGVGSRVLRSFISEDAPTVFGVIVTEVLLPAAKSMIVDAGKEALDRIFYGESRPRRGVIGDRSSSINYNRAGEFRRDTGRSISQRERTSHHFDEQLIFPKRALAMDVIERLQAIIDEYDAATVGDLYDLIGITEEYTDKKWGWTNLATAEVRAVREGYRLELPETKALT